MHSPWRLKGLPPKQTWDDWSWDRHFHGLARRSELHSFNSRVNWKVSQSRLLNASMSLLEREQLLWWLQLEHRLLMGSKNVNQSELHFREHARRPQTWSQMTRLPTCQRKRWNLRRSLPTTSPQWLGILQRAKSVPWPSVTLRFVSSVLVRRVRTWKSWRLCSLRL